MCSAIITNLNSIMPTAKDPTAAVRDEARALPKLKEMAEKEPHRYSGSTGWVTLRFTAEKPIPKTLWKKWIKESYQIAGGDRRAR